MAEQILDKPRTRKAHAHKTRPKTIRSTNKLSSEKGTSDHNKPSIKSPVVVDANKPMTSGFRNLVHHPWSHGRAQPLPTPPRPNPPPRTQPPPSRLSAVERGPRPHYSSGAGHHTLNEQKPSYSYSSPSSYYSPSHSHNGRNFHRRHHGHHHHHHPEFHSVYSPQTHYHGKL